VNTLQTIRLALARRSCELPVQRQLLEHALPARSARVSDMEMIALDFETTGLDTKRDRIIAAGWVLIRGDRIVMATARELRVRDESPDGVGQSAVVHGILDSDLDDAEGNEAMIEQLLPELAGRAIVAHAASIERGFLASLLRRLGGTSLPNPFICTMTLERHLIEGSGGTVHELQGDLTLDACRTRRGLPDHQRHSAGADALATAELFLAQVAQLGGAEKVTLRDLG
jgi:DNA polymerase III subunit epsilon